MTKRTCAEPDCAAPAAARDLCSRHYQRLLKHGTTELPKRTIQREQECSVEGCTTLAKGAHGWCHMHYRRWRLHGSLELPTSPERPESCAVEGCDKGGRLTRGWCATHYYRWRTHGDVQADIPIKEPRNVTQCTVPGCDRSDGLTRGLCSKHYQRWKKHGDPTYEPEPKPKECTVAGCGKPCDSKGLCQKHYMRLRRTGSTADPVKEPRQVRECSIDGCTKLEDRRGYCTTHYNRWKRHGDPLVVLRTWTRADSDTCAEDGCSAPHFAKGLCRRHWAAAHHQANREVRNARMREHYQANREEYYAKTNRRRQVIDAQMDALDRALSADYRRAIANDPCFYCGTLSVSVDHYFPIAKGGTDHWFNLVRACETCNKSKSARCGTWFQLIAGGGRGARRAASVT